MSRTWLLFALILVAVGGAVATQVPGFLGKSTPPATEPPPRTTVVAFGRLVPATGVVSVAGDPNARVARLLVAEGQAVKAGDVLAYLDSYDEMVASQAYAAAQLQSAVDQLAAKVAVEDQNVAQAQADLNDAIEVAPDDVKAKVARIAKMEQQLAQTKSEVDKYKGLVASGAVAKIELERKQTDLAGQQKELEAAREELKKDKSAEQHKVSQARNALAVAKANQQLAAHSIDIEGLRGNVKLAETRVAKSIIHAPISGQVLNIVTRPGESIGNNPILKLADVSTMEASAEVYETDVHLIKPGQKATVTARALPQPLTGKVAGVGRFVAKQRVFSDDPTARNDARVVEVRVTLDPSENAGRLINLQTVVTFQLDGPAPAAGRSP
jgi:HlyD family secretion protein